MTAETIALLYSAILRRSGMDSRTDMLIHRWNHVRRLTYDLLDVLNEQPASILSSSLPFARSQTLGYQLYCMLGAQESYTTEIARGIWSGFSCSVSLRRDTVTASLFRDHMLAADRRLLKIVEERTNQPGGLGQAKVDDVLLTLLSHETQHHGQLINFIFFLSLPIPPSWHEEWALQYEESDE